MIILTLTYLSSKDGSDRRDPNLGRKIRGDLIFRDIVDMVDLVLLGDTEEVSTLAEVSCSLSSGSHCLYANRDQLEERASQGEEIP